MHALIHVKKFIWAHETSNSMLRKTCSILYEVNLALLSHHPLLDFG
jgi:hypothetical protein